MEMTKSQADWGRVLAVKEGDAILYEAGNWPFDPNDAEAVRVWFARADRTLNGEASAPSHHFHEGSGWA